MKLKFDSDDDLPLNKPLKFHVMAIIVRSVFEEGGELYQQIFLDGTLRCNTKKLMLQKELTLIKEVHQ